MSIRMARLPEGTRVRVRGAHLPLEPGTRGRTGTVVEASDRESERLGVALDGEESVRLFMPAELEVVEHVPLPPEREAAKSRPALP
jgi:hypothetical protein